MPSLKRKGCISCTPINALPLVGRDGEGVKDDATRLIKYFLAALTIPEKDLWVNLSPYEKDRIVPEAFGQTEMGRDLLAQDYILKQITASVIYPEGEIGKQFWAKVYAKAQEKYGTTDVPVDTFNKVWIIPEKATVYENKDAAFVVESKLKVMLDSDYFAMENSSSPTRGFSRMPNGHEAQDMAKAILREIVIPILEQEVNEGKNFATLRQVYNSLILATWYKRKVKDSIMGQAYADKQKTTGIDIADKNEKEKIWVQYVEAFKKGAYNLIKEEIEPASQEIIPRKYFSGGIDLKMNVFRSIDLAMLPDKKNVIDVQVDMTMTMKGDDFSKPLTVVESLPSYATDLADVYRGYSDYESFLVTRRNSYDPPLRKNTGENNAALIMGKDAKSLLALRYFAYGFVMTPEWDQWVLDGIMETVRLIISWSISDILAFNDIRKVEVGRRVLYFLSYMKLHPINLLGPWGSVPEEYQYFFENDFKKLQDLQIERRLISIHDSLMQIICQSLIDEQNTSKPGYAFLRDFLPILEKKHYLMRYITHHAQFNRFKSIQENGLDIAFTESGDENGSFIFFNDWLRLGFIDPKLERGMIGSSHFLLRVLADAPTVWETRIPDRDYKDEASHFLATKVPPEFVEIVDPYEPWKAYSIQSISSLRDFFENRLPPFLSDNALKNDIAFKYSLQDKTMSFSKQMVEKIGGLESLGGIDLTPSKMALQVKDDGDAINFNLNPAMLERMQNASGVTPVIIGINALDNLAAFMGVVEPMGK